MDDDVNPKQKTRLENSAKPTDPAAAPSRSTAAAAAPTPTQSATQEVTDADFEEIGHCNTHIVGIQHYSGLINKREQMILKRQPKNQYDANAIAVHNAADVMVGHIPRESARVLAPLMDKKHVIIEAFTTTSVGGTYKVPLVLHIFAEPSKIEALKKHFQKDVIRYTLPLDTRPAETPTGRRAEKDAFDAVLGSAFSALDEPNPDLKPQKPTGDFVGTLMPYQEYSLAWMLQRETSRAISFGDNTSGTLKRRRSTKTAAIDIDTLRQEDAASTFFWTKADDKKTGKAVYTHTLTNHKSNTPPTMPRGGILGDDMGLGKTVQLLALLSHPVAVAKGGSSSKIAATLIVAPLSLLSHWEAHVQQFLPKKRVVVYYGSDRANSGINEADVVIATYGTVRSEHVSGAKKSSLFTRVWGRIILDEAHSIKNANSQTAVACCALKSEVNWCATGTPLQNRLDDLYSLLKFIRFEPFAERHWWRGMIVKVMRDQDPRGPVRLGAVLKYCCLRRTKDSTFNGKPLLTLTSITEHVERIALSEDELARYKALHSAIMEKINKLVESKAPGAQAAGLVLLLRLRQFCADPSLLPEDVAAAVLNTPATSSAPTSESVEEYGKLLLGLSEVEDCPVCLESLTEPLVLKCKHMLCSQCYDGMRATGLTACPLCRAEAEVAARLSDIVKPGTQPDELQAGSKVKAALRLVQRHNDAGEKVVVFSQWPQLLKLVAKALDKEKIGHAMLLGSMPMAERKANVDRFTSDASARVMLLSKMAGGTGLNLVCASACVLVEPWWNPSVDRQSIMRIHRIGQTRPVNVYRLVVRDSVEEKIVDFAAKKQKLFDGSLRGTGGNSDSTKVTLDLNEVRELLM